MASDWKPPLTQARREQAAYARLREQAISWTSSYLELATSVLKCDEERLIELMLEGRLRPYNRLLFSMFLRGQSREAIEQAFLRGYNGNGEVSVVDKFHGGEIINLSIYFGFLWRRYLQGRWSYPLYMLLHSLPLEEALIRYFCFYNATISFYDRVMSCDNLCDVGLIYPGKKGDIPKLRAFDRDSLHEYGLEQLRWDLSQIAPWESNKIDYFLLGRRGVRDLDRYSYMRHVTHESLTLPSRAKSARSVAVH